MKRLVGAATLFSCLLLGNSLPAQSAGQFNIAWKTLGGDQLWSDVLVFGKWRIQRNEITDHYRLLDPADVRRAWGAAQECRTALADIKRIDQLSPLDGKAVITLHGLGRSRDHMSAIGSFLEQQGGITWINISYASTRRSLDDHAQTLAHVIEGLDGIDEIHLVAHSLGSLVVRRYLGEAGQPNPRWQPDPRIKRMVMLGPPNQGAQLAHVVAELLNDNDMVRLIAGPSAWQLARQWDDVRALLATPAFEFGVIAGGCGTPSGLNPLLKGDDDLVVTVEETRLPGAADFRIVAARHGHLVADPLVQKYVLNFLTHGYFTSADERQPILAQAPPAASNRP